MDDRAGEDVLPAAPDEVEVLRGVGETRARGITKSPFRRSARLASRILPFMYSWVSGFVMSRRLARTV